MSNTDYAGVDDGDEDKEPTFFSKLIACPGITANFLYHTDDENVSWYCTLRPFTWCTVMTFLIVLWLLSGAFWVLMFYFVTVWPMKALYAFLIAGAAFIALFAFLIATYKQEQLDGAVGCSAEELKEHITPLMAEGMTWDNFGRKWHIVQEFGLMSENPSYGPEESLQHVQERLHYTNTKPIWIRDIKTRGSVQQNRGSSFHESKYEEKKEKVVTVHQ